MSISLQEFKKEDDVLRAIDSRIARMQQDLFFVATLEIIIKRHEGRKITRAIETALKKLPTMEKYTIYYRHEHGMKHIIIWGDDRKYEDRFSSLLGYDDDERLIHEVWREKNQCHFLDAERIKKLQVGKKAVPWLVTNWNRCIEDLRKVNHNAESYGLQYDFDLIERGRR